MSTTNTTIVKIEELDRSLQTRTCTDAETVTEYAELMKDGTSFPAVTVFSDGNTFYLVDGFHRVAAAESIGKAEIEAKVIGGDRASALSYALKANAEHGRRRTNADKHHALEIAWENREILFKGDEPTCRSLAAICCVSKTMANDFLELKTVSVTDKTDHNESKKERAASKLLKEGKDRFGVAIPEPILNVFTSKELNLIYKGINKLRSEINEHLQAKDMAFATLSQTVTLDLNNAMTGIRFSAPYCVCRACQGIGCYRCKELGFMTRSQYNALPPEFKAEER